MLLVRVHYGFIPMLTHNDAGRYRCIRSYLSQSSHWKSYDPFFSQKQETLRGSGKAIYRSSIPSINQSWPSFSHITFFKKKRDSDYTSQIRGSERCVRKWSRKFRDPIQGYDSNVSLVSNLLQCNRPHLIEVQGKRYSELISMTLFKRSPSNLNNSGFVPPDPPNTRRHIASTISWQRSSTGSEGVHIAGRPGSCLESFERVEEWTNWFCIGQW